MYAQSIWRIIKRWTVYRIFYILQIQGDGESILAMFTYPQFIHLQAITMPAAKWYRKFQPLKS